LGVTVSTLEEQLALDIANTFLAATDRDWAKDALTYYQVTAESRNDAGTLTQTTSTTAITNAMRGNVSHREAQEARGRFQVGDTYFLISQVVLVAQPLVGDYFTDASGNRWDVIGVNDLSGIWQVYGRQ
jgi:hypothetical protein